MTATYSDVGEVICTRCLTPDLGWNWDGTVRCEPCHRAIHGGRAVDDLMLSDYETFGDWWTDDFLDRVAARESS